MTATQVTSAARRLRADAAPSRFALAQVVGRAVTARDAVTFWLAAPGTTHAPAPYQPGQFVTLALPGEGAQRVIYRSYSLCGAGRSDQPWEITVKRRSDGLGSGYLHDRVTIGMSLPVSAPGGAFTLPDARELSGAQTLIFVAAGSGITPIFGMLRALAALPANRRPQARLHYAYHSPQDAIYGDALDALDPQGRWLRQTRYVSSAGRRMAAAEVVAAAGAQAPDAQWYFCGPTDLMRAVRQAALQAGAPAERVHTERFFSPAQRAAQTTTAGARVRVAETGATLLGKPGETLLETLERCGYETDFSCRAGSCGTCRLKLVAGRVRNPDGRALTPAERAAGYIESCVAQPLGEVTIALAGAAAPTPVAPRAMGAGRAARPAGRAATRRKARWSLAVASIALFGLVWNLTDHKVSAATGATSSSSTSGASSGSSSNATSSNSDNSSSSSSSTGTSGSSGFSSQPSSSSSSSSTGVS